MAIEELHQLDDLLDVFARTHVFDTEHWPSLQALLSQPWDACSILDYALDDTTPPAQLVCHHGGACDGFVPITRTTAWILPHGNEDGAPDALTLDLEAADFDYAGFIARVCDSTPLPAVANVHTINHDAISRAFPKACAALEDAYTLRACIEVQPPPHIRIVQLVCCPRPTNPSQRVCVIRFWACAPW